MTVSNNSGTYNNTIREHAESVRSGSFTRVRSSEPNPHLIEDEYVYGVIDCPDCEPFRGSILVGVKGPIPFLNYGNLEIVRKLRSFAMLHAGWDSYGSDKPSEKAIDRAIDFVRQLDECGIDVYFVAPGPNGEILVELKKDDKAAEIYFYEEEPTEFILFPQTGNEEPQVMPDTAHFSRNVWRPFIKS